MGLLLIVAFSLLFTSVAPLGQEPQIKAADHNRSVHHHHHGVRSHVVSSISIPLHHLQGPRSPTPLPPLPFSTVLRQDDRRILSLAFRLNSGLDRHDTVDPASYDMSSPLRPGSSFGLGNYVTSVTLGTPPSTYPMIVDTGSSLTWLQCLPCNVSCHEQSVPIFDPSASSSYSSVPCSSPECASLPAATFNPNACSAAPTNSCVYEASYGDASFSVGFLSKDTLKIGNLVVDNFVYGCGQDNEGLLGKAAGLVGLAKNNLSFLSQTKDEAGAYAFSYCLPTPSAVGSLSFGPYSASRFSFTPMVSNPLESSLYFINLTGVAVAGKQLPVPPSSYRTPAIIDSGTVISRLPSDVYTGLSKAVAAAMKKYKRAPAYSILDTCFVGNVKNMAAPPVSLVFEGGAEMKLTGRNVLVDVDDKTTCLSFAPATVITVIGNRQQQTFDVVYDVDKGMIGFAAGGCG